MMIAGCDAAREAALYLSALFLGCHIFSLDAKTTLFLLVSFSILLIIWKTARSALFGWARLERVHRLILQEKWEIEHHRTQEKEELMELYKAKGFKDHQLEEIIEVLMADDNRLLQIMLEEELGLSLGSFEHPLRQCLGALVGSFGACALFTMFSFYLPLFFPFALALALTGFSAFMSAKTLSNDKIKHMTWTLASSFVALLIAYYVLESLLLVFGKGP